MPHVCCSCGTRIAIPAPAVGAPIVCPGCAAVLRAVGVEAGGGDDFDHRLTITAGPERIGETFLLGGPGPIEIGKLPNKAIQLDGSLVSRTHARLERGGRHWKVRDLASTNGLYVNDARISDQPLHDGDRVRIGEYTLEYHANADADAIPADAEDYALSIPAEELKPPARSSLRRIESTPAAPLDGTGRRCPSCGRVMHAGSKICARCGIYIDTGRPLLTSREGEIESHRSQIETSLRVVALFLWLGIFPIASEAYGRRRPYAVWAITVLTIVVSIWFGYCQRYRPGSMHELKMLMLWGGAAPTPELVSFGYDQGIGNPEADWGDPIAFERSKAAVKAERKVSDDMVPVVAYDRLTASEKYFGEFRWYQLFTHAFLHAGWLHLIGNLIFLIVLGSRVNALIGNVATAVIYPLLAVAAAAAQLWDTASGQPAPMLGASGAIMGLAGMYFVLFPVYRVYVAAWFLPFWVKVGATRGFVILLFYMSFDVINTLLGSQDGVAHWAHMGGFIAGMILAFGLLLTRAINAHGGDLLSLALGKHAWPLIGSPAHWQQTDGDGWLQRIDPLGKKKSPRPTLIAQPAIAPTIVVPTPADHSSALPPRRIAEPRPMESNDDAIGERWIAIAKWTWPLLIILPIVVWKLWPDPAFVHTAGAAIKHPPTQTTIRGGKWWRHKNYTLTPLAEYQVEGVVLSKAGNNDELSDVSPIDLVLGWGTMSDPQVIPTAHFQQAHRGFRVTFDQLPPDTPWSSLMNQFANFSVIFADAAAARQIAGVPVGKTVILKGKLVQVQLPNGLVWKSGTEAAGVTGGETRLIWVEQVTVK